MVTQLTHEQHAILEQHGDKPMPLVDPADQKVYFLVPEICSSDSLRYSMMMPSMFARPTTLNPKSLGRLVGTIPRWMYTTTTSRRGPSKAC